MNKIFLPIIDLLKIAAEKNSSPPNYRPAIGSVAKCASCKYFNSLKSSCEEYDVVVDPNYVCSSWEGTKMSLNNKKIQIGKLEPEDIKLEYKKQSSYVPQKNFYDDFGVMGPPNSLLRNMPKSLLTRILPILKTSFKQQPLMAKLVSRMSQPSNEWVSPQKSASFDDSLFYHFDKNLLKYATLSKLALPWQLLKNINNPKDPANPTGQQPNAPQPGQNANNNQENAQQNKDNVPNPNIPGNQVGGNDNAALLPKPPQFSPKLQELIIRVILDLAENVKKSGKANEIWLPNGGDINALRKMSWNELWAIYVSIFNKFKESQPGINLDPEGFIRDIETKFEEEKKKRQEQAGAGGGVGGFIPGGGMNPWGFGGAALSGVGPALGASPVGPGIGGVPGHFIPPAIWGLNPPLPENPNKPGAGGPGRSSQRQPGQPVQPEEPVPQPGGPGQQPGRPARGTADNDTQQLDAIDKNVLHFVSWMRNLIREIMINGGQAVILNEKGERVIINKRAEYEKQLAEIIRKLHELRQKRQEILRRRPELGRNRPNPFAGVDIDNPKLQQPGANPDLQPNQPNQPEQPNQQNQPVGQLNQSIKPGFGAQAGPGVTAFSNNLLNTGFSDFSDMFTQQPGYDVNFGVKEPQQDFAYGQQPENENSFLNFNVTPELTNNFNKLYFNNQLSSYWDTANFSDNFSVNTKPENNLVQKPKLPGLPKPGIPSLKNLIGKSNNLV
jgi:hypothetical protein